MAAPLIGMDPNAARQLAAQLDASANTMEHTFNSLLNRLGQTGWAGNDRRAFEERMQSVHRAKLMKTVQSLRNAANTIRRHADDQIRTSRA